MISPLERHVLELVAIHGQVCLRTIREAIATARQRCMYDEDSDPHFVAYIVKLYKTKTKRLP
jgi:hypothetical protein